MKRVFGFFAVLMVAMIALTGCKDEEKYIAPHNKWFEKTVEIKGVNTCVNCFYMDDDNYPKDDLAEDAKGIMNKKGLYVALTGVTGDNASTVTNAIGSNLYYIQYVGSSEATWDAAYIFNGRDFLDNGTSNTPYLLKKNNGQNVKTLGELVSAWQNLSWKDIAIDILGKI